MESRIGWLGSSSEKKQVDETLISADTYTGEVVRLTPEQLAIVKAHEQPNEESMQDLMDWLGVNTAEEAEAYLAEIETEELR